MKNLISRLLEKRGVKDVSELAPEERADVERWTAILSTGEITVDKLTEFCKNKVKLIEGEWKNLDNSERKNERLIAYHSVYKTLLDIITGDAGKSEREALERYLNDLITKS